MSQPLSLSHSEMLFHGLDSREQCGLKIIKWNWKYIGASVSPPVNLASLCLPPPLIEQISEHQEELRRILTPEEGCFLDLSLISASSRRLLLAL